MLCFILSFIKAEVKETDENELAKTFTKKMKDIASDLNTKVKTSDDLDFDYPE